MTKDAPQTMAGLCSPAASAKQRKRGPERRSYCAHAAAGLTRHAWAMPRALPRAGTFLDAAAPQLACECMVPFCGAAASSRPVVRAESLLLFCG